MLFEGREFPYVECRECHSLYCHRMPDEAVLAQLYGPGYYAATAGQHAVTDPKQPERVENWLRGSAAGTFLDYGCGSGSLLVAVQRLGWQAVGVEFDPVVAADAERRTSARIVDRFTLPKLLGRPIADVLHLGDVIEHLTDPNRQLPPVLQLIKPGGTLLAQGPLENNPTLFTLMLRGARVLRRRKPARMAPYHVMLATALGQRRLFDRFGLRQIEYAIHEVAWPAPSSLCWDDWRRPRPVALFAIRRISQAISALRPGRLGNRYFYVGRWPGGVADSSETGTAVDTVT